MITIRGLSARYGRRQVLHDVSLQLEPGEVALLLGANGAGKSTLLRCLLGLMPFDGEIRVAGRDAARDGRAVRSLVGYMPQSGGLHPDLTVAQTMRLYADIRGVDAARVTGLLEDAGLAVEHATPVGELSGGMRQRLGFALALLSDPPVLVLDEPSASLDVASRRWLAARLRAAAAEGRTVLVSTHASQELFDAGGRRLTIEDGRLTGSDERDAAALAPSPAPIPGVVRTGRWQPVARKEWRDAWRNRWLVGYAALLAVLGFAATATGLDSLTGLSLDAFGRTTATLMNLCLLLAPLVAVLMGAAAIAGERERGTLEHLLAQPLSRSGLLLAKHAGLLAALGSATTIGFLPAGVLIAVASGAHLIGAYLLFPAIATLAAAALAGVGLWISVSSRSAAEAQGSAVVTWFALGLLYDLLLIGALAASGLPVEGLVAALFLNPIDAARVLGVLALEPDLYLLGPAGALLSARLSTAGAVSLLAAALLAWVCLPVAAAMVRFSFVLERKPAHDPYRTRAARDSGRTRRDHRVRVGRSVAGP